MDTKKASQTLSPDSRQVKDKLHTQYTSWKIGSVKYGRYDYESDEHFFSNDDMPRKNRAAHQAMKDLTDPDILGLKKREWNTSAAVPKNPTAEETFAGKLMKIRMGLLDQPIQKIREPKIEPGCDGRDKYTGWNVSTELPTIYQSKCTLDAKTTQSLTKTHGKFRQIEPNYTDPTKSITVYNDKLRKIKEDEKDLRDEQRKKYVFENPAACKEKVDAGVFRMVYEHKVRNMRPKSEEEAKNLTFKPDLGVTTKQRKIMVQHHVGKFGKTQQNDREQWTCCNQEHEGAPGCYTNEIDPNGGVIPTNTINKPKFYKYYHTGKWCTINTKVGEILSGWSCCMSEEERARGCNRVEIDPKHWNLTSYAL
jgi:hypothetical protein